MSAITHKIEVQVQPVAVAVAPNLYRYGFFSPEASAARKGLVSRLVRPILLNALLLWACLSLFFGSLLSGNDISKIRVTAVSQDGGWIGNAIIDGIKKSLETPMPHLDWAFENGHDDFWSRRLVLDERAWAVLQVSANASIHLQDALDWEDESYDPQSALAIYYVSARNQVTTLSMAVPAIMGVLNPILSTLAANSTATYLQSNSNASIRNSPPRCLQCLIYPVAIKQIDLIPFTPPVAFGILNTGLIFLLTFTFNIFTLLRSGAETYGHLFTLRTQILTRTTSSLLAYLFLSLAYTLLILFFHIPLTGYFSTTGRGFMALWMLNWCTMAACGLILEAIFTLIGMQWASFFLNIWIIANVSGSFADFEVMPGFYKYGVAMPFYHAIQATRTIVFGTKSHFGLNFGILLVWSAVGWASMCGYMAWRVRGAKKKGVHLVP